MEMLEEYSPFKEGGALPRTPPEDDRPVDT